MAARFSQVFIYEPDQGGRALERIPYETPPFDEAGLQEILRLHPELLAIDQIEAIYSPSVCIGREVSMSGWPIDNLYISPNGYITIVETKLWKNSGARREVVAQVIEYAKELAKRSYTDLETLARRYFAKYFPSESERSLADWVSDRAGVPCDEQEFIDATSRCLKSGRFLLLIVGEGIRESAIDLVEHVNATPELGYNLNIVELGCYRLSPAEPQLVLVPRVIASTIQIERAVVRIEMVGTADSQVKVEVLTPTAVAKVGEAGGERVATPTAEDYYDRLSQSIGASKAQILRDFIDRLEGFGVTPNYTKVGVGLWFQPGWKGAKELQVSSFTNAGKMSAGTGTMMKHLQTMGLPESLVTDLWSSLHQINPAFPSPAVLEGRKFVLFNAVDVIKELPAAEQIIRQFVENVEASVPTQREG